MILLWIIAGIVAVLVVAAIALAMRRRQSTIAIGYASPPSRVPTLKINPFGA